MQCANKTCKQLCVCFLVSDVVKARRGQTHLSTCFFTQSQARRIQALLSYCFSNFGPFLTFKFHKQFWRQKFCYRFEQQLTNPLQTLSFPLSLSRCVKNAFSKAEPKLLFIYHYISGAALIIMLAETKGRQFTRVSAQIKFSRSNIGSINQHFSLELVSNLLVEETILCINITEMTCLIHSLVDDTHNIVYNSI